MVEVVRLCFVEVCPYSVYVPILIKMHGLHGHVSSYDIEIIFCHCCRWCNIRYGICKMVRGWSQAYVRNPNCIAGKLIRWWPPAYNGRIHRSLWRNLSPKRRCCQVWCLPPDNWNVDYTCRKMFSLDGWFSALRPNQGLVECLSLTLLPMPPCTFNWS